MADKSTHIDPLRRFRKRLGARIAEARVKAKLGQKDLGPQRTVTRWETGAGEPSAWDLQEIAEKCSVTVGWLFGEGDGLVLEGTMPPDLRAALQAWMARTSRGSRSAARP